MVSARRRWRLLIPWIVKPCSRVLRRFSGELTTIQYWALRAAGFLRLRAAPRVCSCGASSATCGASSATCGASSAILKAAPEAAVGRTEVHRLGHQRDQVAELREMTDLVRDDLAAGVQQGDFAQGA